MKNYAKPSLASEEDWESWRISRMLLSGSMYDAHIFLEAGFRAPGVQSPVPRETGQAPLPGCYMVTSGQQALELVEHESLDLLITDLQLSDMNGFELARRVKELKPDLTVILLTGNETYLRSGVAIPERSTVDRIFSWSGNPDVIGSILQLVEDHANADRHILGKNVRCVLLVEDEPNFFSHYLVMIHNELRERSLALIPPSATPAERARRLRQMPKLLLAETCEGATELFDRYGEHIIGVISDVQFPHGGTINPRAGLKLAMDVKRRSPRIPVILQSHQSDLKKEIYQAGAFFVRKDSEGLILKVRQILLDYFGFGDFIFRMPDGTEVGRARNLRELADQVKKVPLESFLHHGRANHFSTWLYLHGRYELAELLRPIDIQGNGEPFRSRLLEIIRPYLSKKKKR